MKNPYKKFDGMTYRDIRWRLRGQGLPDEIVEKTVEAVQEERAAKSNAKRQQTVHTKAWQELVSALQHERRIVRSMVRYKTAQPAPERDALISAYFDALNRLYEKLEVQRRRGGMPEHGHWTDYVPQRIKDAFAEEAAGIPPRHKAKFKEPFQRTSPIDLRNLRHARLLRRTTKEREAVLLRLQTNPEDEQAKRKIEVLDMALPRIRSMPENAHVPDHWRDVVPEMFDKPELLHDEPQAPRKPRGPYTGSIPASIILAANSRNGVKPRPL